MVVNPINPTAVYVAMVETGCMKLEFDLTYPVYLNGIIRQDEFQQSIETINQAIPWRILFVVGVTTIGSFDGHKSSTLIIAGSVVFSFGMILLSFGNYFMQTRRTTQIQQAVARESMKYSMRSPIPCSWRLNVSSSWFGGYQFYRRGRFVYQLVIEIRNGSVMYQSNQIAPQPVSFIPQRHQIPPQSVSLFPYQNQIDPQPTSFFQQQNYILPPPPYNGPYNAGYCSQCGIPRQDRMAKFYSSYGQQF